AVKRGEEALPAALKILEEHLAQTKWMMGAEFGLVDCAYCPVLNVIEKSNFSFTRLLRPRRSGTAPFGSRRDLQVKPAAGLAREIRSAAHGLRRSYLQRSFPPPRRPSAPDRAGRAALRRAALHAPIQDQCQSAVRRRAVAMASGLRRMGTRGRNARAAG